MARRKVTWKKGKIFTRKFTAKRSRDGRKISWTERGRWEYPNGKKKGRRWRKVR